MKVREDALVIPDNCLVFFIDDTGHENLAQGHPVYGLGGCAALGRDLDNLIVRPWRVVREILTGSPDTRLHASRLRTIMDQASIDVAAEVISQFFMLPFFRFAATVSNLTKLPNEMSVMRAMKRLTEQRINEIVGRTLCREVKVIFEASERADPLIEEAFHDLDVRHGEKPIPTECYFIAKKVGDTGLEVADFVMQAVGRQMNQNLKHRDGFRRDFRAIFRAVDREYTSFMETDAITIKRQLGESR